MAEAELSNETGEITDISTAIGSLGELLWHILIISAPKGVFCLSSASSFPEDCARLKLSSARASQAGLKEMMM